MLRFSTGISRIASQFTKFSRSLVAPTLITMAIFGTATSVNAFEMPLISELGRNQQREHDRIHRQYVDSLNDIVNRSRIRQQYYQPNYGHQYYSQQQLQQLNYQLWLQQMQQQSGYYYGW